jgi:hypothetical protein
MATHLRIMQSHLAFSLLHHPGKLDGVELGKFI